MSGQLRLKLRGKYTITASGRGKLKIKVNDAIVLESEGEDFSKTKGKVASLNKRNTILVEYESPKKGDAWMRIYWESEKFRREPIPNEVLKHDRNATPVRLGRRLREGRELWVTMRCLKCHQAEEWPKTTSMPELDMDAPSLADIGGRLHTEWLTRWIQDPKALRPTATMPRLFPESATGLDGKVDERARDIAVYLSTLGKEEKWTAPAKKEQQEGQRLFAHLGCIACHVPPTTEPMEEDDFDRIPLRDIVSKWKPAALQKFLQKPEEHYNWIRMPNLHLTEKEASRLTAYLTSVKKRSLIPSEVPKGDIERGRKLVLSTGCLNCHRLGETTSSLQAPKVADIKKWDEGCLSEEVKERKGAPLYSLGKDQRDAILDLRQTAWHSFGRKVADEFSTRRVKNLRCIACHQRDGEVAYWTDLETDIEELLEGLPEEKKPEELAMLQIRPQLTWGGEKLQPEWMAALFADKLSYKPRPFLRARMPAFPHQAKLLAEGLAQEHGFTPTNEPHPKPMPKLAEVGQELTSARKWNCIGCHDVGEKKAVGVFEAPGVNFQIVRERLRSEYFQRWLWSPTRVWPGTKMPTVYQWGEPSQLATVLGGSSEKQIEALWNYLLQGRKIVPPK